MTGDVFADILIEGTLSEGPVVANDYTLGVEEIEGGHRLIVQHGGQTQTANIMNGEDAEVDASLTQAGQAADAAVTGQRFARMDAEVNRKVKRLYRLTRGQAWDAESDTAEAYSKTVPAGAHAVGIEAVGGKTIVFNQLQPNSHSSVRRNIHFDFDNTLNELRITGLSSGAALWLVNGEGSTTPNLTSQVYAGHKYLFDVGNPEFDGGGVSTRWGAVRIESRRNDITTPSTLFNMSVPARIWTAEEDDLIDIQVLYNPSIEANAAYHFLVIDLTLMFGAAVADTISTPEEAYALGCPRNAAPYERNTGELRSAAVDAVVVTDENGDEISRMDIPAAVRALPGYGLSAGTVCNGIEYSADTDEWNFVKRVGSRAYQSGDESNAACVTDGTTTCFSIGSAVKTDITQMMPAYDLLDCEAGGTVTFCQTGGETILPVPNDMTYFINLSEAIEDE